MGPPLFEVRGLEVVLGGRTVVGPLDLDIQSGAFLGILGPNGSGKTTLLRALTGTTAPAAGQILLEGRPLRSYRATHLARTIGVVPQQFSLDFNFTVEEMVAMGRYAHGTRGPVPHTADDTPPALADGEAVAAALSATGVSALAGRLVTGLSGGERQRALIAQTLAQETPVLLLDEPLNNLDLNHQLEIMQLLNRLHAQGRTIAVVLHDLNMAAQYCDELLLLDGGKIAARGRPSDILDPRLILEVFKVRVAVHRQGQRPYLTPLWSRAGVSGLSLEKRVHVMAGGGAASPVIEELVLHGVSPTVGIVSIFDTDYTTAQRYELEVVSAPPFEPFPPDAVQELDTLVEQAETVIVAPVFFGKGNLTLLRSALGAARAGKRVVLISEPPVGARDLCEGQASMLVEELVAAGALEVAAASDAATRV